ncbi:hypothetical protein OIO90_000388 [Microbotryomycetes sp. JL221]|nr:hypothetical protein OIO90_000388 [Microbotryomycetes sp. JL221]
MPRPPPGIGQALEAWLRSARSTGIKHPHKPHNKPFSTNPTGHSQPAAWHSSHPSTNVKPGSSTHSNVVFKSAQSLLKLITDGVFGTIKSSSYNHPHGPYSSSRLVRPNQTWTTSRGFATRSSIKPNRVSLGPSATTPRLATHSIGLGTARGFASGASQGVWTNIVINVPLGLRAVGHDAVLDQRKWKRIKRQQTHEYVRKNKHIVTKQTLDQTLFLTKRQEFEHYFKPKQEIVTTTLLDKPSEVTRLPVVLVIQVEPDLSFVNEYDDPFESIEPSTFRILTPNVVSHFETITSTYSKHARRVKQLHDNLVRSGAFDHVGTTTSAVSWREYDGRETKQVHVVFGNGWTKGDVKNAIGQWLLYDVEFERDSWFKVIDLEEQEQERRRNVLFDSEDTLSSAAPHESQDFDIKSQCSDDVCSTHQNVVDTFLLPTVNSSSHSDDDACSLSLSPTLSSASIVDDNWNNDVGVYNSISTFDNFTSLDTSQLVDESPWSDTVSSNYEQGLHEFLRELDLVQSRL